MKSSCDALCCKEIPESNHGQGMDKKDYAECKGDAFLKILLAIGCNIGQNNV